MVCLEIEKGWAFAFWRYQFKQDIQADVLSMLLWYTRENHPVISCHTVILVLSADLCRSLGPGDDRNGTTTEGGNVFEDQPGGIGTCQVPLVWFCRNVSARCHPRSTSASSLPAGVTWQFLCKSSADSRTAKIRQTHVCCRWCHIVVCTPHGMHVYYIIIYDIFICTDPFPKIWDLPFASLGILLSVTASYNLHHLQMMPPFKHKSLQ